MRRAAWLRAVTVALLISTVSSCDKMANQPKRLPYEHRAGDAATSNDLPPEGVVARDEAPAPPPPPVTLALLQRGRQRFDIYCAPCHSRAGDGQGMIVQRGFPAPPPYTDDRLLAAPSQHFYDVITNGYGAMFSYADRVAPEDRWAIAAYIRALQVSQHASLDQAPADVRDRLER